MAVGLVTSKWTNLVTSCQHSIRKNKKFKNRGYNKMRDGKYATPRVLLPNKMEDSIKQEYNWSFRSREKRGTGTIIIQL